MVTLGAAGKPARSHFLSCHPLNLRVETPPVCDYEGSTYQTSFWDQGRRAYEDAVEEVALRRLLPTSGKLMLELGAGAGRNTPRYRGFERVVLLDYSRSQLEQARRRLGDSPRYVYVAANVYCLPFVTGLFDAATMIRTLHHMADAPRALAQVRSVLQPGAAFILEYANKHNLKAMLRYALRRQKWSPYALEPVEFAALNFDFHPSAVRGWLRGAGFRVERQLTVSHFRAGVFKKVLPLRLLVAMDSLAQLTGNWWQLSPSVFAACRATEEGEIAAEGAFFRCPACGFGPLEDKPPAVVCPACDRTYPVVDGIYDFRVN